MGILKIQPAVRQGARLVIGLAGTSGSGKTYTALQLAEGLAGGDPGKVGLLDTENGRGGLYGDILTGPFLMAQLDAPFSPARYAQAIDEFEAAGVDVLVIDSVTHEWEGLGGCIDISEKHAMRGRANWAKAKREHNTFMSRLLASDMHIIVCIRAREKVRMEGTGSDMKVIPLGIQPAQEKNFMFEMTASLLMFDEGQSQDVMKCPAALKSALGRGKGYLTPADGAAVRAWVEGGSPVDREAKKYLDRLRGVTEKGVQYVRDAWGKCPDRVRTALGEDTLEQLIASAQAFEDADRTPADELASIVGTDE